MTNTGIEEYITEGQFIGYYEDCIRLEDVEKIIKTIRQEEQARILAIVEHMKQEIDIDRSGFVNNAWEMNTLEELKQKIQGGK